MALPATGLISLNHVNVELGLPATTTISMNDAGLRTLFGQSTGVVDLNTGHGKSNGFIFNQVISADVYNYNLKAAAIVQGWNQVDRLIATITIGSAIKVGSTGAYAFDTGSGFPTGTLLSLIISGGAYIVGSAGAAGRGGYGDNPSTAIGVAGSAGNTAFISRHPISVTNQGTIAGGGGGGGGGGFGQNQGSNTSSGGGGGGGQGLIGGAGGLGYMSNSGTAGTFTSTGVGGIGDPFWLGAGGNGGNGGSFGQPGNPGSQGAGSAYAGGAGGPGGAAVNGNAFITWVAAGTRLGAVA